MTREEIETLVEVAKDKELDRPRFLGCVAVLCAGTGRSGETLISGCSRGDFKRAIKRLRESQRASPQHVWAFENAILYIRRDWLHREPGKLQAMGRGGDRVKEKYNQACAVLSRLGAYSHYDGFSQAAYAAALCAKEPERRHSLIARVYMETAEHYGISWVAVEENIREIGGILWRDNRAGLDALFGFSMTREPTAALLVAALASSLEIEPTSDRNEV